MFEVNPLSSDGNSGSRLTFIVIAIYWLWVEGRESYWELHYPLRNQQDCESGNFHCCLPHTRRLMRHILRWGHVFSSSCFHALCHTFYGELYCDTLSTLPLVCLGPTDIMKTWKMNLENYVAMHNVDGYSDSRQGSSFNFWKCLQCQTYFLLFSNY